MTYHYTILQLGEQSEKLFANLPHLNSQDNGFDLNDYHTVYNGSITADNQTEALEQLYTIFNINHPNDFKGHSLSVSDVVKLNDTLFYCNRIGWKKLD